MYRKLTKKYGSLLLGVGVLNVMIPSQNATALVLVDKLDKPAMDTARADVYKMWVPPSWSMPAASSGDISIGKDGAEWQFEKGDVWRITKAAEEDENTFLAVWFKERNGDPEHITYCYVMLKDLKLNDYNNLEKLKVIVTKTGADGACSTEIMK